MTAKRRSKMWSYNAGSKGKGDWVRAYADSRDGKLFLEWLEPKLNEDGEPLLEDGRPRTQRVRMRLVDMVDRPEHHALATERADEVSEQFRSLSHTSTHSLTTARLLTLYTVEVTPGKGESKQDHDRRARRLWIAFLNMQEEEERRSERHPSTFDRVDWDRFIRARRDGRIPGFGPVKNRQIAYDLKFMISVLNWATGTKGRDGRHYLVQNPWRPEVRRAQKWPMPKERNPRRPAMPPELQELLAAHAPSWQFGAAMLIERHTRRRNSSIRRLAWSDCDMERRTILWRWELDKSGREIVTPMLDEVYDVLRGLPERGIGDAPVFPSATDPAKSTPRNTWQIWLRRAKARLLKSIADPAKREQLRAAMKGLGYHGEKRAGVRAPEFRRLPDKAKELYSGTSLVTLNNIYDDMDLEELRAALEGLRTG